MIRSSVNLEHHRIIALILAFVSIFISDSIKGLTFTSILYLGLIFFIHLYHNGFKIKYNYLSIIVALNLFFLTLVIRGVCSLNYEFVLKDLGTARLIFNSSEFLSDGLKKKYIVFLNLLLFSF